MWRMTFLIGALIVEVHGRAVARVTAGSVRTGQETEDRILATLGGKLPTMSSVTNSLATRTVPDASVL